MRAKSSRALAMGGDFQLSLSNCGLFACASSEEACYLTADRASPTATSLQTDPADQNAPLATERKFSWSLWVAILRQPVVLGLAATTFIDGFGKPVFLTYVPQYLVTQQGFDLESAGALSSLPFLALWLGTLVGGVLADYLHNGPLRWSNVAVRRFMVVMPQVNYAACGVLLALRDPQTLF